MLQSHVSKVRFCSQRAYIQNRAHWQIFFFHFNSWYTFSSVFFNSMTGLFSCIFWFEDSFLCKFTYLHLLSRLQGRIRQKIYDGRKNTSDWQTFHSNVIHPLEIPILLLESGFRTSQKFPEVLFYAYIYWWKLQFSCLVNVNR